MTLVALYQSEDPVLISDVLISHVALPAVRLTPTGVAVRTDTRPDTYNPRGFSQKTVLFDEGRVMLGISGRVVEARMAAHSLADAVRDGLTPERFSAWHKRASILYGKRANLIVLWAGDQGVSIATVGQWMGRPTNYAADVVYSGSGSDWIKRFLFGQGAVVQQVGELSNRERIIGQAIAQTGFHLLNERLLGLQDHFGGGFQITSLVGDRFETLSDVVYLSWAVSHDRPDEPRQLDLVPVIVAQRAAGDSVAFDVWTLEELSTTRNDQETVFEGKASVTRTLVPSLLSGRQASLGADPPDLAIVEWTHSQILHYRDEKPIGFRNAPMFGDPSLHPITVEGKVGGRVRIGVQAELCDAWAAGNEAEMSDGPLAGAS